jgi:hypothetical protein
MTSAPSGAPLSGSKPQPTVYTALLIVASVVLLATLIVTLNVLMSPMPKGYGMDFGDLFKALGQ